MLTTLVQPVLKCMHFFHTIVVFILNFSFHIGRAIIQMLVQTYSVFKLIISAFGIFGEDLYCFLCELENSITAFLKYVLSSVNGGIDFVLEFVGGFVKHIAKVFINTRLHTNLLATYIRSFLKDFLSLIRNSLLLIGDCTWWLITLLPRWMLYTIIALANVVQQSLIAIFNGLVYMVGVIVEDVFRLTSAIVFLILLWYNRRRLCLATLFWLLQVMRFFKMCAICLLRVTRGSIRRRNISNSITYRTTYGTRRRYFLPRNKTSVCNNEKTLESNQRCVVCRDRQKCVLLLPCKHLCLCEECSNYMFLRSQSQNCPLCRTFIEHSMSVYV